MTTGGEIAWQERRAAPEMEIAMMPNPSFRPTGETASHPVGTMTRLASRRRRFIIAKNGSGAATSFHHTYTIQRHYITSHHRRVTTTLDTAEVKSDCCDDKRATNKCDDDDDALNSYEHFCADRNTTDSSPTRPK